MPGKQRSIVEEFPQRLKQLRQDRGWSQGQLAKKIDIDTQRISKYERGLAAPPMEAMVQLAVVLEVSLDYLIQGKQGNTIKNQKLLQRLEELGTLPEDYQDTLVSVLDSFIKRYKFEQLAQS